MTKRPMVTPIFDCQSSENIIAYQVEHECLGPKGRIFEIDYPNYAAIVKIRADNYAGDIYRKLMNGEPIT